MSCLSPPTCFSFLTTWWYLINHAQLIAFKIRTKSSHLVKWKLIQLFYTMAMIHLTYRHTHIHTPSTCSLLAISNSGSSGFSQCSLLVTFCEFFVHHFSFNTYEYECSFFIHRLKLCLEFFLWSFEKLSQIGTMLFNLEKRKKVSERKQTQIRKKQILTVSCLKSIASLFLLFKSKLNPSNLC